jgi:hypothetical protein
MTDEQDMTVPVTRGEMHQAFETWAKTIVDTLIDTLTTMIAATEQRLMIEIGRATTASAEQLRAEFRADNAQLIKSAEETSRAELRAFDDKYKSLPPRVERLEDAVFKPKPKRRAKG